MLNRSLFFAALLLTAAAHAQVKLYVFDCGAIDFADVSAFSITNDETPVRTLFVPCYLIDHPDGKLLWDAGLPPALAGKGDVEMQPGVMLRYQRSLTDQLQDLNLTPADIDLVAFSHLHFDHTGAAGLFTAAKQLIQAPEWQAGFIDQNLPSAEPELYLGLTDSERLELNGDHDVFGDGTVRIISAPGHTPGHQVLLLNLAQTGKIMLSGDLYHFRYSRAHRRVPTFNVDAKQTLASMDKVEALLQDTGATLWIEHDNELAQTLRKAPAYYD